jgi:hypothetical protein
MGCEMAIGVRLTCDDGICDGHAALTSFTNVFFKGLPDDPTSLLARTSVEPVPVVVAPPRAQSEVSG